jgi:selenide,water dikinase
MAATESMATLNRGAAEVARRHGIRAVTDVTGFGLIGHLSEMGRASRVSLEIWYEELPLLPHAVELVQAGVAPGGTMRNLDFTKDWTTFAPELEEWQRLLVCDAQTSGGLVLAVPPEKLEAVLDDLQSAGTPASAVIGVAVSAREPLLNVLKDRR